MAGVSDILSKLESSHDLKPIGGISGRSYCRYDGHEVAGVCDRLQVQ